MTTIKQVISDKGFEVKSIEPEVDSIEAIKIMAKSGVGSLVVIKDGNVIGIFSEKDFSRKVIVNDRHTENVPVSEVMSAPVIAIKPSQTIEEGLSIMTEKRVRHLPVMDGDKLVGLISIGDLVKAIIKDQQFTIEQLEHYIHYS